MKIWSWNVNGIRAAAKNGFEKWFSDVNPDVVCLQEIKAFPEQLDQFLLHPKKFHSFWFPAEKPGYSGTAIYSRKEPLKVTQGLGIPEFDKEGRVLSVEFDDVVVLSAYFPNSQRDHARLDYKLRFCDAMMKHLKGIVKKGKNVVLCGDYNIAHEAIDLKNPKQNENNAGFLPEERAWMTKFLSSGFKDTFRHFEKGPNHYTWWSYRPGVREKNIGWRLDYHCVNDELIDRVRESSIHPHIKGSDHCPVFLNIRN